MKILHHMVGKCDFSAAAQGGGEEKKIYIHLHCSVLLSVYDSHTPGTRLEPASKHAHSALLCCDKKRQRRGWSLGQHGSCTTTLLDHRCSHTYGALFLCSAEGRQASCPYSYLMGFYAANDLCLAPGV